MTELRDSPEGGARPAGAVGALALLLVLVACTTAVMPSPSTSDPVASELASTTPSSPFDRSGTGWSLAVTGSPEGPAVANDVVHAAIGLVAVGVQAHHHPPDLFGVPDTMRSPLPTLGPTPLHSGRIWLSTDGESWTDVTPGDALANSRMTHVIERSDGAVVAVGALTHSNDEGIAREGPHVAWITRDGVSWSATSLGVPEGVHVLELEQGPVGLVALVRVSDGTAVHTIWFSSDGTEWEEVLSITGNAIDVAAGVDGFVILAEPGPYGETREPFAFASADGRDWVAASDPPPELLFHLAPLGGDWVATGYGFGASPNPLGVWHSTDGLTWQRQGEIPLDSLSVRSTSCVEVPVSLISAGESVVLSPDLGFPCTEQDFVVHGRPRVSTDGVTWFALPFPVGTPGVTNSGSTVRAAAMLDDRLVLIGQSSGQAAFWIMDDPSIDDD